MFACRKPSSFLASQLEEAVADGADVRGIMYWTLVDNFEWAFSFKPQVWL